MNRRYDNIWVSDAIAIETGNAGLKLGLSMIDYVHRDGSLPRIKARYVNDLRDEAQYLYVRESGNPSEIIIKRNVMHVDLVLMHEIGHLLDHQVLGDVGYHSSVHHPDMRGWRLAVDSTHLVAVIRGNSARDWASVISGLGNEVEVPVDRGYASYLADFKELFARSYQQYIVGKCLTSEDGTIRRRAEQLAHVIDQVRSGIESQLYPQFWRQEEFASIGKALDEVFSAKGWLT